MILYHSLSINGITELKPFLSEHKNRMCIWRLNFVEAAYFCIYKCFCLTNHFNTSCLISPSML